MKKIILLCLLPVSIFAAISGGYFGGGGVSEEEFDNFKSEVASNYVPWTEEGNILLPNNNKLLGTDTNGAAHNLIELNQWGQVDVGSATTPLNFNTPDKITVQVHGESGPEAQHVLLNKNPIAEGVLTVNPEIVMVETTVSGCPDDTYNGLYSFWTNFNYLGEAFTNAHGRYLFFDMEYFYNGGWLLHSAPPTVTYNEEYDYWDVYYSVTYMYGDDWITGETYGWNDATGNPIEGMEHSPEPGVQERGGSLLAKQYLVNDLPSITTQLMHYLPNSYVAAKSRSALINFLGTPDPATHSFLTIDIDGPVTVSPIARMLASIGTSYGGKLNFKADRAMGSINAYRGFIDMSGRTYASTFNLATEYGSGNTNNTIIRLTGNNWGSYISAFLTTAGTNETSVIRSMVAGGVGTYKGRHIIAAGDKLTVTNNQVVVAATNRATRMDNAVHTDNLVLFNAANPNTFGRLWFSNEVLYVTTPAGVTKTIQLN